MEVTHVKCFEGPEGVYLNPHLDEIYLITNKSFHMFIDKETLECKSIYKYDIEYEDQVYRNKAIVGYENAIYLGEL